MKVFSLWRGMIEMPKTMREILAEVCADYDLDRDDMLSPARWQPLARARQDFMARATEAGKTRSAIGRFLHRDHTTVLHGVRAHARRAAA